MKCMKNMNLNDVIDYLHDLFILQNMKYDSGT